ncbi:MAG: lytic transglycosylase protein [Paenibacillus sp.]|nr:lytic transglycosylase protein [Paenibacillus sp.]
MNSIDPRFMKQLLQAQLKPDLDGLSSNASTGSDKMDFATLLGGLLELTGSDNSGTTGQGIGTIPTTQATLPPLGLKKLAAVLPPVTGSKNSSYDEIVQQASTMFGVDEALIHSVIQAESGYRSNVVSSAGAKGLMQLMDGTAKQLGVTDSFDPTQNVFGGTRYLASLLQRYNGNEAVALAAYNAGPGRVDSLGIRNNEQLQDKMSQLPLETQKYVTNILSGLR